MVGWYFGESDKAVKMPSPHLYFFHDSFHLIRARLQAHDSCHNRERLALDLSRVYAGVVRRSAGQRHDSHSAGQLQRLSGWTRFSDGDRTCQRGVSRVKSIHFQGACDELVEARLLQVKGRARRDGAGNQLERRQFRSVDAAHVSCHGAFVQLFPFLTDVQVINEAAEKNVNLQAHLEHQDGRLKLLVDFTPSVNLEQVQLFINSSNPSLRVDENIFFFANLKAQDKRSFETEIKMNESTGGDIFSNELSILVSFINKQSIARAFRHVMNIPKTFFLEKSAPQKDGMFKVTLTISTLRLSDLFKGNSTHAG